VRVNELRMVVTVDDFEASLHLYRDVLGLREIDAVTSSEGRVAILEAGKATLELTDPEHARYIDEVEVGRRVAGHIRLALGVEDVDVAT
jgi:lactoylglutathione lyase